MGRNTPLDYYTDQGPLGPRSVLPLRCFLLLLPNNIHCNAIMQKFSYVDKREVLQQEYSQPPILPFSHFPWVVKSFFKLTCD